MRVLVFYAGLLYKDFETTSRNSSFSKLFNIPVEAYYRYEEPSNGFRWYRGDHTPLADEHVPKELLTLALLLT